MSKFKISLLATIVALAPFGLVCNAAGLADLSYDASGATVTITGCETSAAGGLVIPSSIEGKSVTAIGPSAFFGCHGLTSVDTGPSVTSIGSLAFFGNQGIQSVKLGAAVKTIGTRAFNSCSALTTVTLNQGLETIEASAFERSAKLERITIPATVTTIGKNSFRYDSELRYIHIEGDAPTLGENAFDSIHIFATITIPPGNPEFPETVSGIPVYIKAGNLSYSARGDTASVVDCEDSAAGQQEILLTINGKPVTSIDRNAFDGCTFITGVSIPDSVDSIGFRAFGNCSSLRSIRIPDAVSTISNEAFTNCQSLESVDLGEGVIRLENSAFAGSGLKTVTIPDSVTNIGNSTFSNCSNLKSATVGNQVTFLGNSSFSFCSNLTEITLGARVSRIGFRTFDGCHQLTSVFFLGNAPGSVRPDIFSSLDGNVTVYALPDATRFRETFGGAPVVILGDETALPPTSTPTPPVAGALSINLIQFDATGNLILTLSGSNDGVSISYTADLNSPFQTITDVTSQGTNELMIPADSAAIQSEQGFFQVIQE